jgi:hypothetical protein
MCRPCGSSRKFSMVNRAGEIELVDNIRVAVLREAALTGQHFRGMSGDALIMARQRSSQRTIRLMLSDVFLYAMPGIVNQSRVGVNPPIFIENFHNAYYHIFTSSGSARGGSPGHAGR